MTQLLKIAGCEQPDRECDVVFVHGLDGDAKSTWHPKGRPSDFFPAWLGEELPKIGVWSLDYDAHSLAWHGTSMPLADRATNVLALLELHDLATRPLIFVTHSLGGLLVKQMLRHASDLGGNEWKQLVGQTRGIVFISTPHSGSSLANWIKYVGHVLRANVTVDDLQAHDGRLRELNNWYRVNANSLSIATDVYFETQKLAGILVVDQTSADPGIGGVVPIPLDHDHVSICKPDSKNDMLFRRVRRFVEKHGIQGSNRTKVPVISVDNALTSASNNVGTATVSVQTGLFNVQLRIDQNFHSFSESDKQRVLRRIQEVLEMGGPMEGDVSEGSVIFDVKGLTAAQAERLKWAVERGDFDDLKVISVELFEKSKAGDSALVDEYKDLIEGIEGDVFDPIETSAGFEVNRIVEGRVIRLDEEVVLVDIGFKSEGTIPRHEWDDSDEPPKVGDVIKVLIEELEEDQAFVDESQGKIVLSRRKALKILNWQLMMESIKEGQVVTGVVTRKIKGGLLVDVNGVNVFLPASQVDIRRPNDIGDYIGKSVQCEVLKIDEALRKIVVSRRSLIEKQCEEDRSHLLTELEVGQTRKGIVKNIADFGAFVDLGGIDGLLQIADMSWERISHPSEMMAIDQEIEVMILHIDREKQKIALGLKQKQVNPWDNVIDKYSVGKVVKGQVVNMMSYGAFVKLEPGIEGLVHISEMSWTKRINHPNELVQIGDEIDVVILNVDKQGQQLSLGMKQAQENPWTKVAERYPVDNVVKGNVRNLTNYGAFIELEEGIDGLLHVSDMSWTRKISHPSEMLEKGQEVKCKVLSIDQERRRITLGLKHLTDDPWAHDIPSKYQPGQVVHGKVTKITNFGVFVGLQDGLEGLLHISELADYKVENPEEVCKVGDQIEVKILRIDIDERKIGVSRKRVEWAEDDNVPGPAEKRYTAKPADWIKTAQNESGSRDQESD